MTGKLNFQRHRDDQGIDEILICSPVPERVVPHDIAEARAHAFLKIAIVERYKTSGLSGNEWRFSSSLYAREERRSDWRRISDYGQLQWAPAWFYPEMYGDFEAGKWTAEFAARKVGAIAFSWKGLPVWSTSHDGKAVPLLVAAGHLPFAWAQAGDQGSDPTPLKELCCQPGCARPLVSIYRLKQRYCQAGHKTDPLTHGGQVEVRGFCGDHLRRGDCGLDDADDNYEVVSGPGPDGHEPNPNVVKEAAFGGTIEMSPENPT
jgi:hypothetical protein